jgi:hypothetical protein
MDKKFFDNTIIAQYAVTGVPLKVYVDSRYLTITDPDDIENPFIGHGMEPNGEMYPFSYPDIDHLLVADNIIDLETYNKAMADQFKSDEPAEEAPEVKRKHLQVKSQLQKKHQKRKHQKRKFQKKNQQQKKVLK